MTKLWMIALLACGSSPPPRAPASTEDVVLPVRYAEHRFFVQTRTAAGASLELFTDTGGGLFLYDRTAKRLGLATERVDDDDVVRWPTLARDVWIPGSNVVNDYISVLPYEGDEGLGDGMLGGPWFVGRVWIFDYPRRTLTVRTRGGLPATGNRVPLAFQSADGKRISPYARITIEVDAKPIEVLFDTGATTTLTDDARALVGDGGPAERATSFIVATIFDRWRSEHPGWRVIERAERTSGEPLIEVPELVVAGHRIGPVWFTRRADQNFRDPEQGMSQYMDRPIDGALGGSALKYFKISADYPAAIAVFER